MTYGHRMQPTCTRCGYAGAPHTSSHGGPSGCLLILLLCIGIVPGLLYLVFTSTTKMRHCPQCGGFLGQSEGAGCAGVIAAVCLLLFLGVLGVALSSTFAR